MTREIQNPADARLPKPGQIVATRTGPAAAANRLQTQRDPRHVTLFVLGSVLNLLLGGVLVMAAILRETPEFWRNAGGYPLLLRDLVLVLFYPGWLVLGVGVLQTSGLAWQWRQASQPGGNIWIMCAGQWLVLLAVVAIFSWNNLANLFVNAPLHQHLR